MPAATAPASPRPPNPFVPAHSTVSRRRPRCPPRRCRKRSPYRSSMRIPTCWCSTSRPAWSSTPRRATKTAPWSTPCSPIAATRLPGIGGEKRPGIVHRLDKDTSGVMVVAKTEQALATLSAAFAARDLDRAYLALCWGLPNPAAGEIEGADRPRPARAQAHGRGRPRRQAGAHPLPHARPAPGRRRAAGGAAGHRAHPPDPRPPRQQAAIRWSATRSTSAASRPSPARSTSRPGAPCSISRARRCMRPGSDSPIRAPAPPLSFRTPPPADMQALLDRLGLGG